MAKKYGNNSIDQLLGADRIRKRPASMLGSSGLAGARHGFTEIYGNALDEHSAGYGSRLDVKYYLDGSVSIRDYGRGVPLGWNSNDRIKNWNWHIIYNELYGGGKYETNQEALKKVKDWNNFNPLDYTYLFSVGLNGLGAASTQYTSEYFEVKSYRKGKCTSRSFRRGLPLVNGKEFDMFSATAEEIEAIPEEIEKTSEPDGTFIHWKPDALVFDDVNLGSDWLLNTCKDVAGVAGIELHFEDENTGESLVIEAGNLSDIVKEHTEKLVTYEETNEPVLFNTNTFTHGLTKVEGKDYIWVCKCDISFGMAKSEGAVNCYHNSIKMLSGVQYEAVQDALASFLNEKAKSKGIKLDKHDYEGALGVCVSTYSNYASFRNQTKDAVDDQFIYKTIKDALYNKLQIEQGKGNTYVLGLVDKVIQEAQDRLAAEEFTKLNKQMKKVKKEKPPEKFVSCEAYERRKYDEVELWITEGDSAKGAVKQARNSKFQAIFPIRGKGLNVAKQGIKKALANKEIQSIFAIIGTGFDIKLHNAKQKHFNMNDLKVGKIVIATDADEDGYQIRVLLFLVFYHLAPKLLTEGKVFIAETPRFGLDLKDGSRVYAKNDEERDAYIKKIGSKNIKRINRYKGLGEVNKEVLRETTVHPDTRNLIPVTCDMDSPLEDALIDALFGADKNSYRKQLINGYLGGNVEGTESEADDDYVDAM